MILKLAIFFTIISIVFIILLIVLAKYIKRINEVHRFLDLLHDDLYKKIETDLNNGSKIDIKKIDNLWDLVPDFDKLYFSNKELSRENFLDKELLEYLNN